MALYSRVHIWVTNEILTASDLNAEFNNILTNATAAELIGYSANVSQMQTVSDPGGVGTESLAGSASDELTRLRFAIKRIINQAQWYVAPVGSLSTGGIVTGNLASKAVTTAKIDDAAVTATQLGTKAATTAKIDDAAVTATQLASDAVTTVKILDANVTPAKLSSAVSSSTNVGTGSVISTGPANSSLTITLTVGTGRRTLVGVVARAVSGGSSPTLTYNGATQLGLYRGGVSMNPIRSVTGAVDQSFESYFLLDSPSAGSVTYDVRSSAVTNISTNANTVIELYVLVF